MRTFLLIFCFMLSACLRNETVSAYGGMGSWRLVELNGRNVMPIITLNITTGDITGQAPCNSYFTKNAAPYPWFSVESIGATRMACPALDIEHRYFKTLKSMELSEVSGDTLILSNDAGAQMIFKRQFGGGIDQ